MRDSIMVEGIVADPFSGSGFACALLGRGAWRLASIGTDEG